MIQAYKGGYQLLIADSYSFIKMLRPYTIFTKEFPQKWEKGKEAFYPVNDKKNNALYQKYKHEASIVFPNIIFGGRLGCYEYNDMDDTVRKAMVLYEQLANRQSYLEPHL